MKVECRYDHYSNFDDIYHKYYRGVAATVRRFRFTDGVADDLIQEVFIQTWKSLDTLKDLKALGGWIHTIARNICLNEIKRRKKTVPISTTDSPVEYESGQAEIVLVAEDDTANLQFEHSIKLLHELINSHNVEPRATIAKLFYLENMTVKEISEHQNINQNTVLSHLRRFRLVVSKAMVRLIEEKGIELE